MDTKDNQYVFQKALSHLGVVSTYLLIEVSVWAQFGKVAFVKM